MTKQTPEVRAISASVAVAVTVAVAVAVEAEFSNLVPIRPRWN